jgi:hypothetical protein
VKKVAQAERTFMRIFIRMSLVSVGFIHRIHCTALCPQSDKIFDRKPRRNQSVTIQLLGEPFDARPLTPSGRPRLEQPKLHQL